MKSRSITIISFLIIILLSISSFGQSKKNSRPNIDSDKETIVSDAQKSVSKIPVYFYEFSQPNFLISEIKIEHDENGLGKISFKKRDFDEVITEPLTLSESTIDKLNSIWIELNFLESTEVYQSKKRDFGHLGNMTFKMKKENKQRTVGFNWTENKDAKELAAEYRRVSNQFVWMFDMNVSRDNQPLESPKIIKRFEKMLQRNEIADPNQIMPFLKQVSDDEKFPLITRNHANRILKQLKKAKEKTDKKAENAN